MCEAVGDGSRGMQLTNLISGDSSSYFSTVLPVPMVAVIRDPAIVPVDFSAAATPFVNSTAPMNQSNTHPETYQSLASIKASERSLAP